MRKQFKIITGFAGLVLAGLVLAGLLWPSLMALSVEKGAVEKGANEKAKTEQADGRRIALLIVNQHYNKAIGALSDAAADVTKLKSALEKTGFAKDDIVIVRDADRKALRKAVRAHAKKLNDAGKGAVGLLYYIGHTAANTSEKNNVLLPTDLEELSDDIWDDGVATDFVLNKLQKGAKNAANFVIFNAADKPLKLDGVKDAVSGLIKQQALDKMLVAYATANVSTTAQIKGTFSSYANTLADNILKPGVVAEDIFKSLAAASRGIGDKPWMSAQNMPEIYFAGKSKQDGQQQEGRRFALLVGNAAYNDNVGRLRNTLNDVRLVSASLKKLGFDVTIIEDASRENLKAGVEKYAAKVKAAGNGAVSLFYYAGHGAAHPKTKLNYLLPVDVKDTETQAVWQQSLRLDFVVNHLKAQAGNAAHFIVFDACRNELKVGKAVLNGGFSVSKAAGAKLGMPKQAKGGGFQPMTSNAGMLIAYATAPGLTASDGTGKNGPYAKALAAELLSPGIPAIQVFINVQRKVKDLIGQDPWLSFPAIARIFLNGDTSPAELEKLRQESLRLAALSQQQTKEGDAVTGMLLALEALPDKESKDKKRRDRLYVDQAGINLFDAIKKRRETLILSGHTEAVTSAIFSSNGQIVLTASQDLSARLWSAKTGQQLFILNGHKHFIKNIKFSTNGKYALTQGRNTTRLWDTITGKELYLVKGYKSKEMSHIGFSPDGKNFITSSGNVVRLWEVSTGRLLVLLEGHNKGVSSIKFSSDANKIITSSYDRTIFLWDATSGNKIKSIKIDYATNNVIFSPDNNFILIGSNAGIILMNIKTEKILLELKGHDLTVGDISFSPDGKYILTSDGFSAYTRDSKNRTARLWDKKTGKEIAVLGGHSGEVKSLFSPTGQYILTVSTQQSPFLDSIPILWDAKNGKKVSQFEGHKSHINDIRFSADGTKILTASSDTTARIWRVHPLNHYLILKGHKGAVHYAEFSPDNKLVVTASSDKTARLWNVRTGHQLKKFNHKGEVFSARFHSNGQQILTASGDGLVRLWDVNNGEQLKVYKGHLGRVNSASFSPDGRFIISVSNDGTAIFWNKTSGQKIKTFFVSKDSVYNASFSSDGNKFSTGTYENTVKIWDIKKGKVLGKFRGISAKFKSNDQEILVINAKGMVKYFVNSINIKSKKSVAKLKGNTDIVIDASYNYDGSTIVTGSGGILGIPPVASVWDYKTGLQFLALLGHKEQIRSVVFSSDGSRIISTSMDSTARIWFVPRTLADLINETKEKVHRCLTPHERRYFQVKLEPPSWCYEMKKWPYNLKHGYVGLYENGQKHGFGVFVFRSGKRYAGYFNMGKADGKGILILSNGKKFSTVYEDGKELSRIPIK